MRRKSERTATKKTKPSPEKKVEKTKRGRTRRNRKQSSSSENESAGETSPVRAVEVVAEPEKTPPPSAPVKEDSPEETPDQVWQVKTTEGPSDGGEIKKLKICLTRPPSTPERADRSPRSKRKHSRATSSSDTPSVEAVEDKRKKHRSKRATRESKDESDKTQDSQGDESETQTTKSDNAISQSTDAQKSSDETPMSTTNEETKTDSEPKSESTGTKDDSKTTESDVQTDSQKPSDADTTVASPKADTAESQDSQSDINTSSEKGGSTRKRSVSVEKSEVLEIHADESKSESLELSKADEDSKEGPDKEKESTGDKDEVSIIADKKDNTASEEAEATRNESKTRKTTNENHVLESSEHVNKPRIRMRSTDSDKDKYVDSTDRYRSRDLERSDSTQSTQEEIHNGEAAPIVVSRKRRWGSRHSKITTQKSITISTDVLKEIIPDVKPAEFDEVIEEKKHKRIEVTEKLTRPVLPKIIIDNTESVEMHRKDQEDKDKENVKVRDSLGTNRKISIVNDNDNILGRPPSPPRHKQSNILYITNLVRPFTLPQLKNLLQRTGRIVENGFWIDRIKSKCFVKYESEDQAVETRHALHGVTWPVSNPKALQVDFSAQEAFDHAKLNEDTDNAQASTIPGTVEDWLREQDLKRERGELEKPWERKAAMREWDVGKNEKEKEKDRLRRDERPMDKRRHRTPERSPEPAKKFKKKEEEAPAKLLDDLFRKTKTTPCIYWLPLSAETIAVKEEQRRQHMAEHERRLQELRRTHPHPHPHPHRRH